MLSQVVRGGLVATARNTKIHKLLLIKVKCSTFWQWKVSEFTVRWWTLVWFFYCLFCLSVCRRLLPLLKWKRNADCHVASIYLCALIFLSILFLAFYPSERQSTCASWKKRDKSNGFVSVCNSRVADDKHSLNTVLTRSIMAHIYAKKIQLMHKGKVHFIVQQLIWPPTGHANTPSTGVWELIIFEKEIPTKIWAQQVNHWIPASFLAYRCIFAQAADDKLSLV